MILFLVINEASEFFQLIAYSFHDFYLFYKTVSIFSNFALLCFLLVSLIIVLIKTDPISFLMKCNLFGSFIFYPMLH